jgi:hypothetical protein
MFLKLALPWEENLSLGRDIFDIDSIDKITNLGKDSYYYEAPAP